MANDKNSAKGRAKGSVNVSEGDFVSAYVAGDSYESVASALGLKPDTVMNRASSIRKKLLSRKGLTQEQLEKINDKLGPKYKDRSSVGDAAASVLGL